MIKQQTIKIEASQEEADLWKEKARSIGLSRSDYLLCLLQRRDRRFPFVKTATALENFPCPGER